MKKRLLNYWNWLRKNNCLFASPYFLDFTPDDYEFFPSGDIIRAKRFRSVAPHSTQIWLRRTSFSPICYKKLLAEIKILKVVIVCQKYISNHKKMIILTSFYYIIKLWIMNLLNTKINNKMKRSRIYTNYHKLLDIL